MNESFEGSTYVIRTLKYIAEIQKKLKEKKWNFQEDRLSNGLAFDGNRLFSMQKPINTIPIILFSNGEPLNQVGVLTSTDSETNREIYKTFSTYIFRLQYLSGRWAILELLKFKNEQHCYFSRKGHFCSLSCQLDVAAGGGHVTKTLSPHVGHIFATDLTPQMLATAKKHLSASCSNAWYIVADAESLPFLNETFDAVVCRIAAHHFSNPKLFVSEVFRALKPGGKFILIDNVAPADAELDRFMNTTEKLRDESHGRCFSITEWSQWFKEQGFVIKKSEMRRKTFDFPEWVRRTTKSEEQVQTVIDHLLSANQTTLEYFSVVVNDGEILSFQIDEWMVMVEKLVY